MRVSNNLISILKAREELRLIAYPDKKKNGVWTIGWGATYYESGAKVKSGDTITETRAVQLLNYHVGIAAAGVNKYVTTSLAQGQFDALVSFTYNVGVPSFASSTLLKVVNADPNNFKAVQDQLYRWIYDDGVKVNGLVNRRIEEYNIYTGNGSVKKNDLLILAVVAVLAIGFYYVRRVY